MSDSSFLIELRITHREPLQIDAQTLADLAARGITEALKDDPLLLATATGRTGTSAPVYMEGYGAGFLDGKLVALDVIEGTIPGRSKNRHWDEAKAVPS